MAQKTKLITSTVYRSAKTGRFVGKKYEAKNKSTTTKETTKRKTSK